MSGPQPGSGWWRGPDGHWYPPQAHPQVPTPGVSKDHEVKGAEKGERSRAFRDWIQTGQGIGILIVSILGLGGAGAAVAANHPAPTHSGIQTPGPAITNPNPGPSTRITTPGTVTPARLTQALLPAQTLGTTAVVNTRGTDLSQITGICGGPLPNGAQVAAYEVLHDSQTSQDLEEIIIDWGTAAQAGTGITDDRAAVDQTGSCDAARDGTTYEYTGDYAGSPPQECGAGQYFDTQVFIGSSFTSGEQTETQCSSLTVAVLILGAAGSGGTGQEAHGYLDSAVGMLQRTMG